MAYKTILLHLDGSERDDMRLDIAFEFAALDQAHLIVLRAIAPLAYPPLGVFAVGAAGAIADAERDYIDDAEVQAEG